MTLSVSLSWSTLSMKRPNGSKYIDYANVKNNDKVQLALWNSNQKLLTYDGNNIKKKLDAKVMLYGTSIPRKPGTPKGA